MNVVKGDLIQLAMNGNYDVIIHGCNCFCTMGAGIAKQIKTLFPQAFEADQDTLIGNRKKLGTYSSVTVKIKGHKLIIVNAYTQYDFSGQGVLVEYDAVSEVFARIKDDFSGLRIAYPKIGAGLAKGDWKMISGIIDRKLHGENHTLIEYAPA